MSDLFTALLVVITAFYAWATFRILKANQNMAAAMNGQLELQLRPYVQPLLFISPDTNIFCLRIKNIGRSAATNLRLSLDRNFFQFGEKREEKNLRNFTAFSHPIQSFPPSAELEFWLAQGPHLFGNSVDENVTPRIFSVTCTYEYLGKSVEEKTTIDFHPYLNSDIPRHYVAHELREIRSVFKDLERTIVELSRRITKS